MAWVKGDWRYELGQVKEATKEIVDEQLAPLLERSITQAGDELGKVVSHAGEQIQQNIKLMSDEIHNQRRLTKDDIESLIDYAAERIGKTIDERIDTAKQEVSVLFTEKLSQIKIELEDAAKKSRKTLYFNLCMSIAAAVGMAVIGIVYKKISMGDLDLFTLFRVLLLSLATGTGLYAALRTLSQWRNMNRNKKNVVDIAVTHVGFLRPNGAIGLFVLSILLFVTWGFALYYK